jgi:hypothetical protein
MKKLIANRFGLIALLSLFASTAAYAGNPATPVIVTNTTAQPVPVVGIIKDSDAPARKPFQSHKYFSVPPGSSSGVVLTTVPANQRIVLEEVSGYCSNVTGIANIQFFTAQNGTQGIQFLPEDFISKKSAASSIRLYGNTGETLYMGASNTGGLAGGCSLSVAGYYVDLP